MKYKCKNCRTNLDDIGNVCPSCNIILKNNKWIWLSCATIISAILFFSNFIYNIRPNVSKSLEYLINKFSYLLDKSLMICIIIFGIMTFVLFLKRKNYIEVIQD